MLGAPIPLAARPPTTFQGTDQLFALSPRGSVEPTHLVIPFTSCERGVTLLGPSRRGRAARPCDAWDARLGSTHNCVVCKTTHGVDWTYALVNKLNTTL